MEDITKSCIGKRVGATVIDYTILWGLTVFYIVMVGDHSEDGKYSVTGWPALIPVVFWFIYFVIMEQNVGGTFGHLLFKIKVVSLSNERVTLWRTFKRRIADALEIAWCFGLIAFLLAKNTKNSQRLGDILANTCVIGQNDDLKEMEFDFEKSP